MAARAAAGTTTSPPTTHYQRLICVSNGPSRLVYRLACAAAPFRDNMAAAAPALCRRIKTGESPEPGASAGVEWEDEMLSDRTAVNWRRPCLHLRCGRVKRRPDVKTNLETAVENFDVFGIQ